MTARFGGTANCYRHAGGGRFAFVSGLCNNHCMNTFNETSCTLQDILAFADRIETTWTEWADEVVMEAAAEAVEAMRTAVAAIVANRFDD